MGDLKRNVALRKKLNFYQEESHFEALETLLLMVPFQEENEKWI